jgi:hypothetical protein
MLNNNQSIYMVAPLLQGHIISNGYDLDGTNLHVQAFYYLSACESWSDNKGDLLVGGAL